MRRAIIVCWTIAVAGLLLLILGGCGSVLLVEGRDYRIDPRTRTLYTRSAQVADSICATRGLDVSHQRVRTFSAGGSVEPAAGCYDPRDDVIVVEEGNPVAEAHEHKHREDGAWHE